MINRPIAFKPWFIPAIADGRKTQTRRLAMEGRGDRRRPAIARPDPDQSPKGRPGDTLW